MKTTEEERLKLLEDWYIKALLEDNLRIIRKVQKLEVLCVGAVVMSMFVFLSKIAEYLLNLFGYAK